MKVFLYSIVFALLLGVAQTENADQQPVKIGKVSAPNGADVNVYRMVNQGCELFIVAGSGYVTGNVNGQSAHPSITTGRGCH